MSPPPLCAHAVAGGATLPPTARLSCMCHAYLALHLSLFPSCLKGQWEEGLGSFVPFMHVGGLGALAIECCSLVLRPVGAPPMTVMDRAKMDSEVS